MPDDPHSEIESPNDDPLQATLREVRREVWSLSDDVESLRRRVDDLEKRKRQPSIVVVRTILMVLYMMVPIAGIAFLIYYMIYGL